MPKSRPLPPIDELRRLLAYRSDGVLIWKRKRNKKGGGAKPGCVAGWNNGNDYLQIKFDHHVYLVHRIIWGIVKKEDPLWHEIDHINGNRLDNRIQNLRKVTRSQNQQNSKRAKGYSYHICTKKWRAEIRLLGQRRHLGLFDTKEQAREAYLRAKEKLHGQYMPADLKHELGQIDGSTPQFNIFDD